MNLDDPTAVALAVARALADEGLRGAIYGGLALATWGEPRETKDADFALASLDLGRALAALDRIGLAPAPSFERVPFGGNLLTRVALLGASQDVGMNVVDFVEPRSARFAQAVLERALTGSLRGQSVAVVAPEDFVLLKVLSTRAIDIEDAANVLRSLAGRLDEALIDREASQLSVELKDHDVAGRLALARAAAPRP